MIRKFRSVYVSNMHFIPYLSIRYLYEFKIKRKQSILCKKNNIYTLFQEEYHETEVTENLSTLVYLLEKLYDLGRFF